MEPLDPDELARLEQYYNELLAKYGPAYGSPYGWAAAALNNPNPRFADIEKAQAMDHHRPRYKLASHPTHANPKGVLFRLALVGDEIRPVPGASNAGLADPAIGASISLYQATTPLLLHSPGAPSIRSLQFLGAMQALLEELEDEFARIDQQLRREAQDEEGPSVTPVASLDEKSARRLRRRGKTR